MKFDAQTITAITGLVTAIGALLALILHQNGPAHNQPDPPPAPPVDNVQTHP